MEVPLSGRTGRIDGRMNADKYKPFVLLQSVNVHLSATQPLKANKEHKDRVALKEASKCPWVAQWNSPDLNPMVHLWTDLQMEVHRCSPSRLDELERIRLEKQYQILNTLPNILCRLVAKAKTVSILNYNYNVILKKRVQHEGGRGGGGYFANPLEVNW